jgi:hypothetical protein
MSVLLAVTVSLTPTVDMSMSTRWCVPGYGKERLRWGTEKQKENISEN